MKPKPILSLIAALFFLTACTKEKQILPSCQAVTMRYTDNGDTIIHWCKVCDQELEYYRGMPKYQAICNTGRVQEIVIGDDKCKK